MLCVDVFAGWVEAWLVRKVTAQAAAKKLLSEIICRFWVVKISDGDLGKQITGKVMQLTMVVLGIKPAVMHTAFHPIASGKVECCHFTLNETN